MEIILDLTLIFCAATVMLLLMNRYNHPSVPAYILAGVLIGAILPGEDLLNLAQIGIAFLIFIFGLKYSPSNLRSTASATFNTTLIQMTVAGGSGFLIATMIGFNSIESFYIATAAALSSSLVGLQLTEREIHTNLLHGRLSESIHLVQDMVAFGLIAVILATTVESAVYALVYSAIILGSALFVRDYLFDFIAHQAGGNQELLTMAGLTSLIGFIGLTEILGISMVVGAFAAGLAVSRFPYNIELLDTMGSIKDFFSAIFFVVLGALLTFPDRAVLATSTGLVLVTTVVTPLTTYYCLKFFGYDNRTSMLTSLSLGQISELALVIAIQASILGLISSVAFEAIILSATATMIISSYTKKYEEKIYSTLSSEREKREDYDSEEHVIVIGYDTQGKRIVETLEEEETDYIVIDNDPEKISELKQKDVKAIYGDVIDPITWEEANYQEADLIISTVPIDKVSEAILKFEASADTIVRAETPQKAVKLMEKGAVHVIVPDMAAGEKLVEHIEGIANNINHREELRRESLLEFKKFLHR